MPTTLKSQSGQTIAAWCFTSKFNSGCFARQWAVFQAGQHLFYVMRPGDAEGQEFPGLQRVQL